MLNETIGTFISTLRKEQDLTQEELAEKLGVSNRSISRWENGKTLPDLSLLRELSAVLDVSMSELLNGQRLSENTQTEDCVRLALELAQREREILRRSLNHRFGAGLALLLCAALFHHFAEAPQVFFLLCAGLSVAFFFSGFFQNNRRTRMIPSSIITAADVPPHMKTAEEMLQFSKKHQYGQIRQHRVAFEALEAALFEQEYVQFSFIADSCTLNGRPGPWHIGAAITNKRFLFSGETMRGALLPVFPVTSYDRDRLEALSLQDAQLILTCTDTVVKFAGRELPSIYEKLRKFL